MRKAYDVDAGGEYAPGDDALLPGLPRRQTLAGEPSWQDAGIRGGVGYINQSGSMPSIVTTANTSQATYTNAAAVLTG